MLNINKTESENIVYISGVLNELDIREGVTSDGRSWVRGNANIRVDQEINGKVVENIIPIKMFSMALKSDGTPNKVYERILSYKENLVSAAAADDERGIVASRITISGELSGGKIQENFWIDQRTGEERSCFQINANFLNKKRDADKEGATFQLTGVVLNMNEECDKDGNETGRLIIKFCVIGYNGTANVINLIAEGNAKASIEQGWVKGDTVKVTGIVNMTQKIETYKEEQGFGDPIERTRTVSRRELLVTGGTANGLEESLSYDADDIKKALEERKKKLEDLKNKQTAKNTPKAKANDFGF